MWDIQERTLLKCELLTANMTRRARCRGARRAPLAFIRIKMLEEYESREWIVVWVACLSDRTKRRHSTQHNNLRRNESLSLWHEMRYVLYSWSFSKILPSACPCYHPLPSKHPLFATPASNARILNEKEESIGLLRQTSTLDWKTEISELLRDRVWYISHDGDWKQRAAVVESIISCEKIQT